MLLRSGVQMPLVRFRQPFREFLTEFYRDTPRETLREQAVEEFISFVRPYFKHFYYAPLNQAHIDIRATVENMWRKYCSEWVKLVFNNGKMIIIN